MLQLLRISDELCINSEIVSDVYFEYEGEKVVRLTIVTKRGIKHVVTGEFIGKLIATIRRELRVSILGGV